MDNVMCVAAIKVAFAKWNMTPSNIIPFRRSHAGASAIDQSCFIEHLIEADKMVFFPEFKYTTHKVSAVFTFVKNKSKI